MACWQYHSVVYPELQCKEHCAIGVHGRFLARRGPPLPGDAHQSTDLYFEVIRVIEGENVQIIREI